jgi:hypothetical protein
MTIIEKTPDQLLADSIMRQALEAAVRKIETLSGNPSYEQAWKIAVRAIRSLKPD